MTLGTSITLLGWPRDQERLFCLVSLYLSLLYTVVLVSVSVLFSEIWKEHKVGSVGRWSRSWEELGGAGRG